ncbi:hypothetical protein [Dokdonella sp.]|uniref:hypothetical protein n=1 Tax=Dokdonella sp. TaxID=2291710 RepID=UPI002C5F509F|nr:hypothetical protein [Dokdonella sp.]HPN80662.1 hypothetical protein [Dokdonella sp.]
MTQIPHRIDASGRSGFLLPALFLCAGLLLIALPQSRYFSAIPGDLGDPRFNGLILEHLFRWVRGLDESLWSPGFFFPYRGVLAFSDNHFGSGGIYVLLRAIGLSAETSYIGWFTAAFAINYACCYYALRKFGISRLGSSIGAFVFSFAFPVINQGIHAQLGYRFAVPLAALAWMQFLERGELRFLTRSIVWSTVQFFCSIYIGYFLLLLLGAFLVARYANLARHSALPPPHRLVVGMLRHADGRHVLRSAAIILMCGMALALLFYPYVHYSSVYGFARDPGEIGGMLPRLGSYLLADLSILWSGASAHIVDIPMRHEQQMFFGAVACVLAAVGAIKSTNRDARTSAFALLVLVALTLSVRGFSLYPLIEHLPLANAIRAVSRICLVMLFPLALMAGAGVDWLCSSVKGRNFHGSSVAALLVIALLVEYAATNTVATPTQELRDRLTALAAKVPNDLPAEAILFVPRQSQQPLYMTELDGMNLAQILDRNTLNGYSGNSPPGFYASDIDPCADARVRLTGYSHFMQMSESQHLALVDRVYVVGSQPGCAH